MLIVRDSYKPFKNHAVWPRSLGIKEFVASGIRHHGKFDHHLAADELHHLLITVNMLARPYSLPDRWNNDLLNKFRSRLSSGMMTEVLGAQPPSPD